MRKIVYFVLVIIMLFFCGGNEEKKQVVDESIMFVDVVIDYNIFLFFDQFGLLNDLDGKLNLKVLNDLVKLDFYGIMVVKVFNFGVYMVDIVYLIVYYNMDQYFIYFGKFEKIGIEIGVVQVFGKEMNDLVKKYDGNLDFLFVLSNEMYWKIFNCFIEVDKGNDFLLMLIGGWVELFYLMIVFFMGKFLLFE